MELIVLVTRKTKSQEIINECIKDEILETIQFIGKGTASTEIMEALSLEDSDRDVVLLLVESNKHDLIYDALKSNQDFKEVNSGVVFSVNLDSMAASTYHALLGERE